MDTCSSELLWETEIRHEGPAQCLAKSKPSGSGGPCIRHSLVMLFWIKGYLLVVTKVKHFLEQRQAAEEWTSGLQKDGSPEVTCSLPPSFNLTFPSCVQSGARTITPSTVLHDCSPSHQSEAITWGHNDMFTRPGVPYSSAKCLLSEKWNGINCLRESDPREGCFSSSTDYSSSSSLFPPSGV